MLNPLLLQLLVPYGMKFLRVLIFAIFSTIRKKKIPQKIIPAKRISTKIYSTTEIIKITNAKVRLCIFIQKRVFRLKTKLLNYK